MTELARLVDPEALDRCDGARAVLRVEVPAAWLREGGPIRVRVPRRLACARCDGGGCDGCSRSGVLRAPEDEPSRLVEATLPATTAGAAALRIARPFEAGSAVEQLVLEVRAGAAATDGVTRLVEPRSPERPTATLVAVAVVVAALGALLAALAR